MAGSEVFEKNKALFTPIATDYIRAIDDPSGSPLSGNVLFSNNIAGKIYSTNGTTYPVGTLTDTQYLQVSGGSILSVNNSAADGWIPANVTWTYVSATTFTVAGNYSAVYTKGMKFKATMNSVVKQGYILSAVYSAPNTTVTVNGGSGYLRELE